MSKYGPSHSASAPKFDLSKSSGSIGPTLASHYDKPGFGGNFRPWNPFTSPSVSASKVVLPAPFRTTDDGFDQRLREGVSFEPLDKIIEQEESQEETSSESVPHQKKVSKRSLYSVEEYEDDAQEKLDDFMMDKFDPNYFASAEAAGTDKKPAVCSFFIHEGMTCEVSVVLFI